MKRNEPQAVRKSSLFSRIRPSRIPGKPHHSSTSRSTLTGTEELKLWKERRKKRATDFLLLHPSLLKPGTEPLGLERTVAPKPEEAAVLRDTNMTQPCKQARKVIALNGSPSSPSSPRSVLKLAKPPAYFPSPSPGPLAPSSYKSILNGFPPSSPGPHPPNPLSPRYPELSS